MLQQPQKEEGKGGGGGGEAEGGGGGVGFVSLCSLKSTAEQLDRTVGPINSSGVCAEKVNELIEFVWSSGRDSLGGKKRCVCACTSSSYT